MLLLSRLILLPIAIFCLSVSADEFDDFEFDKSSTWQEEEVIEKRKGKAHRKYRRGRVPRRRGQPRVGEIYSGDVERIRTRIRSKNLWSFGFGPYGGIGTKGMIYNLSLGRHWDTSPNGEIRVTLDGAAGDSASFGTLTTGMGYFFSRGNFAPYISGELGAGAASPKEGESASGFAGKVALGARIFRTADTQMDLGLHYNAVFAGSTPGIYGVKLQILY